MSGCIEIKLGNKMFAKISEEDADIISLGNWSAHKSSSGYYVCFRQDFAGIRQRVWMHTLIMEELIGRPLKKGELVDHINGDKLDNRRENLRLASLTQNNMNKGKRKGVSSSKYKGVSFDKQKNKWRAYLVINKKLTHLGHFDDEKEAALAYNNKAFEIYGDFAQLNDVYGS